ncbi:hypothetical protein [Streptomyces daliensis]
MIERPSLAGPLLGEAHANLPVFLPVPGDLPEAVPLIEGMGTGIDREHVKDEVLAPLGRGFDQGPDQPGADASPLVVGVKFDPSQVDLGRAVLDDQYARVGPVDGDDLPSAGVEPALVIGALIVVVPAPTAAT